MNSETKLTLGFSPCPNDTFIFDALVNRKIDTEGISFECIITDVEDLNKKAFNKELDITKLSFNAYFHVAGHYTLLDSGAALGNNCGPLLIAKKTYSLKELENMKIAIPGKYTTANLLLNIVNPDIRDKTELLFSEIVDAVAGGTFDAGLIIHESRFTYQQKGLVKIADLGEYWENMTKLPIPLGGIFARKNFNDELLKKISRIIRKSVEFAINNPSSSSDFVKQHVQELDDAVIKQHISLYVNDFTLDLGETGRKAVEVLQVKAKEY